MKKNYLKPEIEIVEVQTSVLANSAGITDKPSGGGKDAGSSRGEWGNVWAGGSN